MMKRDFQGNIYDDREIEKLLQVIPTFNSPISSYASVDLDELMATIDRLKKIPNTNDLIKENNKLHSNWNSLRECIETDNKRAKGYIERIRTSDLYHGDYPVEYYYAEKRKEITDYYLDKMNQLERNNKL